MGVDKGISFAVPTYYNGNMFYIPISSVTDHITFFQFSDNSRRLLLRWFDQFWKGALSKQSAMAAVLQPVTETICPYPSLAAIAPRFVKILKPAAI
jgi:hypothetical protein